MSATINFDGALLSCFLANCSINLKVSVDSAPHLVHSGTILSRLTMQNDDEDHASVACALCLDGLAQSTSSIYRSDISRRSNSTVPFAYSQTTRITVALPKKFHAVRCTQLRPSPLCHVAATVGICQIWHDVPLAHRFQGPHRPW
jgi:hypothetical protein